MKLDLFVKTSELQFYFEKITYLIIQEDEKNCLI